MTKLAERMTQALFASQYSDRQRAIARWPYEPASTKERYETMGREAARVAQEEIEAALRKAQGE